MSVDIESRVHRTVFNVPLSEQTKELDGGHVIRSTRIILELFKKYRAKATFFVLGTVAEWYTEPIEEMKKTTYYLLELIPFEKEKKRWEKMIK